MLFVTWLKDPFRPTRDLDLLGYGASDAESIADAFKAICGPPAPDDGGSFDFDGLTAAPIREETEYGGVRVQTQAVLDGVLIPIQIDIGFRDVITPGPVEIMYPVLLDAPAPHLRAYPVATVVAEKFNAIVVLGIANSRLKDFCDLWLISRTFEFDGAEFSAAVLRTFKRRETPVPADVPTGLTRLYAEEWNARWKAFLNREHLNAAPDGLNQVFEDLRRFLVPLTAPPVNKSRWPVGGPWSASVNP